LASKQLVSNVAIYLGRQLEFFFPDGNNARENELKKVVECSLEELKVSFSHLSDKYFQGEFENIFSFLHGDHYSMFLYLVSKNFYKLLGDENQASKAFLLNKALHGIDAFYKINMPEVFLFVHPIGTVLGNATYGNFFCVYQNCTVGSKVDNSIYPTFGERTCLYAKVSVIGDCRCQANVIFAANSSLIATNVSANKMVLNNYPNHRFVDVKDSDFDCIFKAS